MGYQSEPFPPDDSDICHCGHDEDDVEFIDWCSSCSRPICDDFVEIDENGKNRGYHIGCELAPLKKCRFCRWEGNTMMGMICPNCKRTGAFDDPDTLN